MLYLCIFMYIYVCLNIYLRASLRSIDKYMIVSFEGAEVEWVKEESYFFRLSNYRLLYFHINNEDLVVKLYKQLNSISIFIVFIHQSLH